MMLPNVKRLWYVIGVAEKVTELTSSLTESYADVRMRADGSGPPKMGPSVTRMISVIEYNIH